MVRIHIRLGFALLAFAVAAPAYAEDSGSDWLGSVTDFVRSGLGPPRTLEDIRREEQQRVPEGLKSAEPKVVAPVPVAVPAPVAEPQAVEPILAAPVPAPEIKPEPKKAEVPRKAEVKPVVPVAQPVPPMPVPEAKPKPVVVRAPPPPPEPLTSRIAATATIDQAVKLGGSAEVYSTRIKIPAHN